MFLPLERLGRAGRDYRRESRAAVPRIVGYQMQAWRADDAPFHPAAPRLTGLAEAA